MKNELTTSEKRVIRALIRLGRPANANEVAKFAEMAWKTSKDTLENLKKEKILRIKPFNGKRCYEIKEGIL